MFDVNFYTVSKNVNSTAQPSGQGTVISCILKRPSSMVDPVLQIQLGATAVPSWNYCYISAFSRYYFISNWTAMAGGVWEASLSVDVLATYKTVIGDTTFLIERASAASDGYLTDTLYPATLDVSDSVITLTQTTASGAWDGFEMPTSFSSGVFILSIVNGDTSGFSYYVLTPSEFRSFKDALYATSISWYDGGNLSDGVKKSIANPFQYINSCIWFPRSPLPSPGPGINIRFGFWDSGVSAHRLPEAAFDYMTLTVSNSSFTKHPQQARGAYLNASPYTKVQAVFNPWGSFELDPAFIMKGYDLQMSARIDYVTGEATLRAESKSNNTIKDLLYIGTAMFGVPIPITQRSLDMGNIGNALGGFAGFATGIATSNPLGTIAGGIAMIGGSIATAIDAAAPSLSTRGTQGSLAALTDPYKIYIRHFPITDEDNSRQGRPLMQNYKPSALNGYMRVVDPDMTGDLGTLGERQQVMGYLTGGFYYE